MELQNTTGDNLLSFQRFFWGFVATPTYVTPIKFVSLVANVKSYFVTGMHVAVQQV